MLKKFITTLGILAVTLSLHAQSTYFNVTETEPFKDSRSGSSLEGAFTLASGKDTFEMIQENKGKTVYRPYLGTYDYDKFILANLSKSKKQFLILSKK